MIEFQITIVVRNEKQGLKLTLESIINRIDKYDSSYLKLLIVDGHSTDGSLELAKECQLKTPAIDIQIVQADPLGVYNAMNLAVELTSCRWIWFINSGDILVAPLERIREELHRSDRSVRAVIGKCGLFFKKTPSKIFFEKERNKKIKPHQSTIYDISLHDKYGYYNEKKIGSSDTIFLSQINDNEILVSNQKFAATLVSPKNISRNPKTIISDSEIGSFKYKTKYYIYIFEAIINFSITTFIKQIYMLLIGDVEIVKFKK